MTMNKQIMIGKKGTERFRTTAADMCYNVFHTKWLQGFLNYKNLAETKYTIYE